MPSDQRRAPRHDLQWEGLIVDPAGAVLCRCKVVNVGATGAKLALKEATDLPDEFVLLLSKNARVQRRCEVVWRAEKSVGVRFIVSPSTKHQAPSYMDDMLNRMLAQK